MVIRLNGRFLGNMFSDDEVTAGCIYVMILVLSKIYAIKLIVYYVHNPQELTFAWALLIYILIELKARQRETNSH